MPTRNLKPKFKIHKASHRDGIYMTVSPSGTVTFRYDYRFNGRRETLTLGRYGLAVSRWAMAHELLLARGKPFSRAYRPSLTINARNAGWSPSRPSAR
ncbi:Arm DNA-binding domain-containing protein [Burkholderia stagnalis]|uniref:Arm DNA-binding domain-containing protein n=1 Tax=Burkholderia stagnalis TaxID=1503054 RepID=UPI004064ACE8